MEQGILASTAKHPNSDTLSRQSAQSHNDAIKDVALSTSPVGNKTNHTSDLDDDLPPTQVVPIKKIAMSSDSKLANNRDDGDDDPLIELSPNRLVKKSQITVDDIKNFIVKCTACGAQLNHYDKHKLKKHRHLGVLICKECSEFYANGQFSEDDEGDKYCRWCAQGGTLYGCDYCTNAFCNACVRRNFFRGEVHRIKEEKWKCYVCEPSRINAKRAYCNLIIDYSLNIKQTQAKKSGKHDQSQSCDVPLDPSEVQPSKWLPASLEYAIASSTKFQKKINKLTTKHSIGEKSAKQIVKKLDKLIDSHRSEMKKIVTTVNKNYCSYIQFKMSNPMKNRQQSTNTLSDDSDVITLDDDSLHAIPKADHKHVKNDLNGNSMCSDEAIDKSVVEHKTEVVENIDDDKEKISMLKEEFSDQTAQCENMEVGESDNFNGTLEILSDISDDSNEQKTAKLESKLIDEECKTTLENIVHATENEKGIVIKKDEAEIDENLEDTQPVAIKNDDEAEITEHCDHPQDIVKNEKDATEIAQNHEDTNADNELAKDKFLSMDCSSPEDDCTAGSDLEAFNEELDEESQCASPTIELSQKEINSKLPEDNTLPQTAESVATPPEVLDPNISRKNSFLQSTGGETSDSADSSNGSSDDIFVKKTLKSKTLSKKHSILKDKNEGKSKELKSLNAGKGTSTESSSSSSDDTSGKDEKKSVFQKRKIRKQIPKKIFSVDEVALWNKQNTENFIDVAKDSKLNGKAIVNMENLNIDTSKYVPATNMSSDTNKPTDAKESTDELEELKKAVENLCKLPKSKRQPDITSEEECDESKKPGQKKPKRKKDYMSSASGSFSLSSSEDEGKKENDIIQKWNLLHNKSETKDKNSLAKENFLKTNTSSDSSSDIEEIDVSKDAKNGKVVEPTKESEKSDDSASLKAPSDRDSSDDFMPKRKKLKQDKLLTMPLEMSGDEKKGQKDKSKAKKKRAKRRIVYSDDSNSKKSSVSSDSSSESSDSDAKSKKQKGNKKNNAKKRKRIKAMNSSSDDARDANSDVEVIGSQDTPGKGRKNIRKVISDKRLTEETKEAQDDEKERRRRVTERQKLYNKIVDVGADGKVTITKKMVLEIDSESKEELVEIHPDLVEKLKPHQVNGIKFMWECTIESLKQLETKPGSGCILAHCMGLGKTLQVIAFLYSIFTNQHVNKKLRTALIICPYNTILNWANEFDMWLEEADGNINIYEMASAKDNYSRLDTLDLWKKLGGVMIIGYNIFQRLVEGKMTRAPKKLKEKVFKLLVDPGPDIVVCDEGHMLKNENSAISKATMKLHTKRRIVLTGTPLQNNLKEYHCMLNFVKPHLLGTSKEFRNRFMNPISNGQYDDSSKHDVKLMKKRVHILHKLLEGCVQRCDYSALTKFLPPKHEFVISVKLSEVQIKMYQYYLDNFARGCGRNSGKIEGGFLFPDYNALKNIWTYPFICQLSFVRAENKRILEDDPDDDSIGSFIDDSSRSSSDQEVKCLDDTKESKKSDDDEEEVVRTYKTRSRRRSNDDELEELNLHNIPERRQWFHEYVSEDDKFKIEQSGKMVLVLDILKECEGIGDKIIIFSQSLLTLDMLEDVLGHVDEQPVTEDDKDRDVVGNWVPGLDYFRMDGSTNVDLRKRWIEIFNDRKNERARLFLISTKAGSLGTNLVGANRVILLDASWNPSHDVQAIFRVYRFGQDKPVYIYRLLAQGTMEEKIYDRQVTKLSLSCRVVDEQQIDRHFNAAQLAELYTFDPDAQSNRPTPMVPNDRLLAEMLIRHNDWIVTYHEHDSLLQSSTEDDLTEEERQAAWTEYENEKEGLLNAANAGLEGLPREEPEFSHNDKPETHVIPNASVIVKGLMERLKMKFPNLSNTEMMNKLFASLNDLMSYYQTRHLRTLRQKQEYVSQGESVPISLNVYLDGLADALQKTKHYMNELRTSLQAQLQRDAIIRQRVQQQQMQQQWQQQAKFNATLNPSWVNSNFSKVPGNQNYNFPQTSLPRQTYPGFRGATPAYVHLNSGRVASNPTPGHTVRFAAATNNQNQGPVITEISSVDKDTSSNRSSPIITEIEEPEMGAQGRMRSTCSSVEITEID